MIHQFNLTLCFLFLALAAAASGQKEKVYSIVKQKKSSEWYETQASLWKEHLKNSPQDAAAWENYYIATRMLKLIDQKKTQEDLDKVVEDMGKAIPDSYEFHHITYWNGGGKPELFHHLEKAYKMQPERPDTYSHMITYYEMLRDKDKVSFFANKWFASNDISPNILAWNYNMLISAEKGSILITLGDNDTYPAMVLQQVMGINKDVALMNLSLIGSKPYQDRYFSELDIPLMKKTPKDFEDFNAYQIALCRHIFENSGREVYFAPSMPHFLYNAFIDDFYNVGLAFKMCKQKFDNIAVTKKNYEKLYLTDYLKIHLSDDLSASVSDQMNASYLVPLLTLHNHYEESEDARLEEVDRLIEMIAEKSDKTDEVAKLLNQFPNPVVSKVIKDPRILMQNMSKVNEKFYVRSYEEDNELYNQFLLDLLKQRRFEDLNVARFHEVDWMALAPEDKADLTFDKAFEHGKPEEDALPVCNVTYEAAELYCQWLTDVYNNLDHRKKKFQQVRFRLPTEKEWEHFASQGKGVKNYNYPWGPYIRNSRGCFLANLKVSHHDPMPPSPDGKSHCEIVEKEVYTDHDGGLFTVPVTSYSPNDFGIYNVVGNVAEMVAEKGVTKGGSWNTPTAEGILSKRSTFQGASPEVGFRVVMEVIE